MPLLQSGDTVALVGCSNPQLLSSQSRIDTLLEILKSLEIHPVCSDFIYENTVPFHTSGETKATAFMTFYRDPKVKVIFDLSGGDLANEVLAHLDYDFIKCNPKPVFGYSDLTTVLNALYAQSGLPTYLYQIRNLISPHGPLQIAAFAESLIGGANTLFDFSYTFLQGEHMAGIVMGGNIRCLLKLAGTPYMPDFKGKILFLESLGGGPAQMTTALNQYKQIGVFDQIAGILLGTFTTMEQENHTPTIEDLVCKVVGNPSLPIAKTTQIGHGTDSKCLTLGQFLTFSSDN